MPDLLIPVGAVSLDEACRLVIEATLVDVGGNQSQAARVLGICRKTMTNKLQRWKAEDSAAAKGCIRETAGDPLST
ncbi:MAG: hypothetical protein EOP38_28595 [Rubrivivax sp.]|nr:MAG: hypothetical protein EOP38_28595 [Rubrivivax sp.]